MQRKIFVELLIVISLAVITLGQPLARVLTSPADDAKSKKIVPSLAEIAQYRQWTLVNPTPVLMDYRAAISCVKILGPEVNPHSTSYASVYINPTGASTMSEKTRPLPRFPEGSIIVKEKLRDKLSKTPELLTVMVKREQGYDEKSRDWEYLVLDGSASQVLERGKLARCNRCHDAYTETDFVTMHYLDWKAGTDRLR